MRLICFRFCVLVVGHDKLVSSLRDNFEEALKGIFNSERTNTPSVEKFVKVVRDPGPIILESGYILFEELMAHEFYLFSLNEKIILRLT